MSEEITVEVREVVNEEYIKLAQEQCKNMETNKLLRVYRSMISALYISEKVRNQSDVPTAVCAEAVLRELQFERGVDGSTIERYTPTEEEALEEFKQLLGRISEFGHSSAEDVVY